MNANTLKYTNEENARNVASRANKMMLIVMGDDGKYWVVTPGQATKLEKAGYEILN